MEVEREVSAVTSLTHPVHEHTHNLWIAPDSRLGRVALLTFVVGFVVTLFAAVLGRFWGDLIGGPDEGLRLFLKLLPLGTGMLLCGIGGVTSIVALVRDHALLLLGSALFGTLIGAVGMSELLFPH
jgi:hypothetical protein